MVKVVLADCQALFRAGISRILSGEDEFRIVAQCSDGSRLASALFSLRAGLVIVSSTLRVDLTGLVAQAQSIGGRVIIIAEDSEPFHPYSALGVSGVIYRSTTSAAFLECVRRVCRGESFVPAGVATPEEDLVGTRARAQLTPKELKILALVLEGLRNKEIAARLDTTEQVVKNKLRSVYDKTGVSDRLELALFALHHRVLAAAAAEVGAEMQLAYA
jgi:DNA-binding NarL/FixJ family response regulator